MDYAGLPYIVEPMKLRDIKEVMEIERVSFPSPWPANAYRHELQRNSLSHYFVARSRAFEGDDERSLSKREVSPNHMRESIKSKTTILREQTERLLVKALPILGERSSKGEGQPLVTNLLPIVEGRSPTLQAVSPQADKGLERKAGRQLATTRGEKVRQGSLAYPPKAAGPAPIVGYGGFWLMAGEAHITTIAVRPELRRRGIGELLLVAMLDRATELGAEVATLEVRVSNIAAQTLYRKYGFRQVGLRRRYYSNNEDALIMTTNRLTSAPFQRRFQGLKVALREKLARGFAPPPPDLDGIGDHHACGRG